MLAKHDKQIRKTEMVRRTSMSTFDFDTPVDRRGTSCIKWDIGPKRLNEPDLIPLSIADTDFSCPSEVTEAIIKRCGHPVFGYTVADQAFYTGIINWFEARHQLHLEKDWLRAGSGVVTAISYAIQTLTSPGDKVLIQSPVYDPFPAVTRGTGRVLVESPLIARNNTYEMDYADLEQQFRNGVRLMILCNPHNPVGRVWTREELQRLAALCLQYHVYIVSDEIHCDFGLFGHRYTSILAIPEIHPLAVCCIAPGKSFNLAGLAASATAVPDAQLNARLADSFRSAWLINNNILGLTATTAAYTYGGEWMDAQLAYLEGNSRLVTERLAKEAPHIVPAVHEGTFLMWLNFRDFGMTNEALSQEVVHTWKLGMNDGWHYGPGGEGYMRLNIGCSRQLLNTVIDRLVQMHHAHFPTA